MKTVLSIKESSAHPHFSSLYQQLGLEETQVQSVRKAIQTLRKAPPELIVAEFFYAFSTNYSGVHISNLDVLLISLAKYSPQTRVIMLVDKSEWEYVQRLEDLYPHQIPVLLQKAHIQVPKLLQEGLK